jgi:2-oxo-4-hydroxy-4-carboxy--5-ureidoimidazoline (OHCU) decarboxylase
MPDARRDRQPADSPRTQSASVTHLRPALARTEAAQRLAAIMSHPSTLSKLLPANEHTDRSDRDGAGGGVA